MGRAILERHEEVDEVRMVLPNLHHWRVDTTPLGGRREVRRVSIWIRRDRGWRVRFHQGTTVPAPNQGRAE